MTGNLLRRRRRRTTRRRSCAPRARSTTARSSRYTDIRRFGTWRVPGRRRAPLAGKLGPEPLGDWSAADLARRCAGRNAPVKAALLDQRVVAGVGNIYADEALWAARIHPALAGGTALARPRGAPPRRRVARSAGGHRRAGRLDPRLPHARRRLRLRTGALRRLRPRRRAVRALRHADPRRTVIAQRGTVYCPHCSAR